MLTNSNAAINTTSKTTILQVAHTLDDINDIMHSSGQQHSSNDEPTDKDELIAHLRAQCNYVRSIPTAVLNVLTLPCCHTCAVLYICSAEVLRRFFFYHCVLNHCCLYY
jgi:hypothetical protein